VSSLIIPHRPRNRIRHSPDQSLRIRPGERFSAGSPKASPTAVPRTTPVSRSAMLSGFMKFRGTEAARDPRARLRLRSLYSYDLSGVDPFYLANSRLVSGVTVKTNLTTPSTVVTVSKVWDNLDILGTISSVAQAGNTYSYGYSYNDANQRVQTRLADGSYSVYDTTGTFPSVSEHLDCVNQCAGGALAILRFLERLGPVLESCAPEAKCYVGVATGVFPEEYNGDCKDKKHCGTPCCGKRVRFTP